MNDTADTTIHEFTEQTFEQEIREPGLTIIDFWAPWCGPCRAMAPQLERAAEMRPEYRFAKVNVDEEPNLAAAFEVQSIPTLAIIRDGQVLGTSAGLVTARQLVEALDKLAA